MSRVLTIRADGKKRIKEIEAQIMARPIEGTWNVQKSEEMCIVCICEFELFSAISGKSVLSRMTFT